MMSYMSSLEKAICYIEKHLYEDIDLSSVAMESGYSLYHFHRIFKNAVGDSLKDYVRKRRMTEAAKQLINTNMPIVEIGIKHGYESREAFSRAFERVYGRNPSEVRTSKSFYSIREPMSLDYMQFRHNLMVDGLTPIFKKLPKRDVVGKRTTLKADGSNLQDIPLLWHDWHTENESAKIAAKKHADESMGICIFADGDEFDYLIGHEVASGCYVPENMEVYHLESSLYAVFSMIGPITESVQKTWDYIYSVWLIESNYEHAGNHDIEYYYFKQGILTADLYVPVISKM